MDPNYSAVIDVLGRYYDGLYHGDTSLLQTAFHPEAHYYTASNGELLHLDMASYFPVVEARTSPASRRDAYGFHIDSIEFAGPVTAFARMRSSMLSKDFIDLLTLIQIDGEWKIISKIFHYDLQHPTSGVSQSGTEGGE